MHLQWAKPRGELFWGANFKSLIEIRIDFLDSDEEGLRSLKPSTAL